MSLRAVLSKAKQPELSTRKLPGNEVLIESRPISYDTPRVRVANDAASTMIQNWRRKPDKASDKNSLRGQLLSLLDSYSTSALPLPESIS